ncbi:glycosyltransferase [Foetidibacter luteolus]|uniref:glycosyltransferase n=1 Tax=Foetidibacter luteolus TaxID=2608880 RepID=UPI00129AF08B|nr:glycosyltransferase [Foetidibacter luteolus]
MNVKKLAIVTDCVHMYTAEGKVATENHIFQKQLEALCALFSETLICCPFVPFTKDKVVSVYQNSTITFSALPNVGGNAVKDKLRLLAAFPAWFKAFAKAAAFADIVYQRFPNNLNIPGLFYFYFRCKKVFATYTGTWKNYSNEPATYRLQKWLLKKLFRGPVFIYTDSAAPGGKLVKSFSPSFDLQEWNEETAYIHKRIERLNAGRIEQPVFITVGSLQQNKNQQFILEVFRILHEQGVSFRLFIVGDGPLRDAYLGFIEKHRLAQKVVLTGKKKYTELKQLYRQAHFVIQAPLAEGFGKVPVEGFCHGVIPLLSNTALAAEMTAGSQRGFVFSTGDPQQVVTLITQVLNRQHDWPKMIADGREYAASLSMESWVAQIKQAISRYYED